MVEAEIVIPFLFVCISVGFLSLCTCCVNAARHTRTLGVIIGEPLGENAEANLRKGMDSDMISSFPIVAYSEIKHKKIGKGLQECAICLSNFEDVDSVRLLPKCGHAFHTDCIDIWLSNHVTCPVCRINLVVEDEKGLQSTELINTGRVTQDNIHVAIRIDEAVGRGTHRFTTDSQEMSLCSHSRNNSLMSS